jgi:hypothetical protein
LIVATATIRELPEIRLALGMDDRERFDRIYTVDAETGVLRLPPEMAAWVEMEYGSTTEVVEQRIVKVTNRWTLQTSLFNPFRARRPLKDSDNRSREDEIYDDGPDPFDEPLQQTSEDVFGRVRGKHCVTAGNLAKSDACHGVIIFDEHNPWLVSEDAFLDAIQVAGRWFAMAHAERQSAVYPLLIWNCLWKSGASINHAHMQLLATGSMHYGEFERFRRTTLEYRHEYGGNYVDDLFQVHASLGLASERDGVRMLAHLTPVLAHECILLSDTMSAAFARMVYRTIRRLHEQRGVESFNLAIFPSPLAGTAEDWSTVPVMARIVDRGSLSRRTVDTGAIELFAASVISTDPFDTASLLQTVDPG